MRETIKCVTKKLYLADIVTVLVLGQTIKGYLHLMKSGKLSFGRIQLCLAIFSIGSYGTIGSDMRDSTTTGTAYTGIMLVHMHKLWPCPSSKWFPITRHIVFL